MSSCEATSSPLRADVMRGERGRFAAAPGIRVAPDGMLRTRRKSSVDASSPGLPSGHKDFTPKPSEHAFSRLPAPEFNRPIFGDQHGSRAAQAIQSLIAATKPVLAKSHAFVSPTSRHVAESVPRGSSLVSDDHQDSGEWAGCEGGSGQSDVELASSPHRPSDDLLSSPPFNILGRHDPVQHSGSEASESSDDYGKKQDEERDKRARSVTRRKVQREKEREAEDVYHVPNKLTAQRPKPVHAPAEPSRAQFSGTAVHTVDEDPVILTGFDPMPEGCDEDDEYEEVEYTGKGKGKASSSGNKGGRMSLESVTACQKFGAEVHRSAQTLATKLNMNLATVMRAAGLSLKATKVGNFANSLRMVLRHEYAEQAEQDSNLGMFHLIINTHLT